MPCHDDTYAWGKGEDDDAPSYKKLQERFEALQTYVREQAIELSKDAAVRQILAGADAGSLPDDYPLAQMAKDRMAEISRLRAEVKRLTRALGETRS